MHGVEYYNYVPMTATVGTRASRASTASVSFCMELPELKDNEKPNQVS